MNGTPFQALDADLAGQELDNDKLYITEEICEHWRQTSRWTSGLVKIGWVFFGSICLGGLLAMSMIGPYLFIVAALGFIPFMLFRNMHHYSVNIRKAADNCEWEALEKAFASLSNAYTIFGMLSLLAGVLLVILFGFACIYVLPTLLSAI